MLKFTHNTAAAAAKLLQSCPTLCDPIDSSPPGSPVPGILQARTLAAAAKSLQSCPTLCDPIDCSPPGSSVPGILQAKSTGVGCHFLLQCMKVKSESEVAQSCPTPSDPMDCSPPGSSVHGTPQARILEWAATSFSRGLSWLRDWTHVCYGRGIVYFLYRLNQPGKSQGRSWTQVFLILSHIINHYMKDIKLGGIYNAMTEKTNQ